MKRNFRENLPRKFTEVVLGAFREKGNEWLEDLPRIISEIESGWSVKIGEPFPNLSYHFVAPCAFNDGFGEAVVKIGCPADAGTVLNEVKMLKFLDGRGVNRILRFDETLYATLLEKLSPGENLKTICGVSADQKAVEIAIGVMRKFWQAPPAADEEFPKLEDWFERLKFAEKTEFDAAYSKKALTFFDELSALTQNKTLLHGDFHHENILSATREPFLAIDPKGIVGDIGYDLTSFLINHANWLKNEIDLREKLDGAIRQFSEAFEIKPRNLRKWVFAHSVLSAWWTFEENCENWREELAFAEIWEV